MAESRDVEQRLQSSKMTQTEQNWTVENTVQSEDKQTQVGIKIERETIKKHRQLTFQIIEEIAQLLEETQTERNEIDFLKTQTEQQQENIERLTSEKHEQFLLIKRLKLQIENVIEKLLENKETALQGKALLLKIQNEIYQERETLDRRHYDIINEQRRLAKIKYDKTISQANNESKEPMEQIQQRQNLIERLMADSESLIDKNRNKMVQTKKAQEQIQKTIANTEQELKIVKREILQNRDHVEKIKHTMNGKINKLKQRWANSQRDAQVEKATEMESRDRKREKQVRFETVKAKLSRIQEGIENVWDVMEYCEQQLDVTMRERWKLKTETSQMDNIKLDSHKQQQETDGNITVTQSETEIWDDMQRQDIGSKLAQIQSERAEIARIKNKIQTNRENVQRDRQLTKTETDTMKCMREYTEKQKQELDSKLLMTKSEMREMEVMSNETEMKKKELAKMIRMSRRKMGESSRTKEDVENSKQDMGERQGRSQRQTSEQMQELNMENKLRQADRTRELMLVEDSREDTKDKVSAVELEDIKKFLHLVGEDTEQSLRDFTEKKSKTKWMKFQTRNKRQEVSQQLEKTIKERDELAIMKLKIQQQGQKVEQKLEGAMTTILSMAAMNTNIEKTAAEINSTWEEMLRTQRKTGKNKEEAKTYMDKLSMKGELHRWILSPIKKTFASKLRQPQRETGIDSFKDQTLKIPAENKKAEDQRITEAVFLHHIVTLQNWNQSDEITEQKHKHSERKLFLVMDMEEEQNICLQIRTEIDEGALIENNETNFLINLREKEEMKKKLSKLKEKEEEIKEQMKYAMENMEENSQEIKRLMEINDLKSQRPETTVKQTGDLEERGTELLEEIELNSSDILTTNVNGKMKYEVQVQMNGKNRKRQSDMMRLDVKPRKQSQESREDLWTHAEEMNGDSDKKCTESTVIQRFSGKFYTTQEIMRSVKVQLENHTEKSKIKDYTKKNCKIQRLLQDMKQFQELLKMLKTAIKQSEMCHKEEMTNMKSMKTAAKKGERELDQKLQKILKERDALEMLKIKIQRETEVFQQRLEKVGKVKRTVEKMVVKTRKKSENVENNLKETEVKLRQLEDLNCRIEATKLDMENCLTSQERAELEKYKIEIRQKKHRESAVEKAERQKESVKKSVSAKTDTEREKLTEKTKGQETESMENENFNCETKQLKKAKIEEVKQTMERELIEAKGQNMNNLQVNTEQKKNEINELKQINKREIREMELLKSELEMKRQENERMFRKNVRKKEENEILWNELQEEKKSLRRETKKSRRELDQRLEKNARHRDELELLRIKMREQKEELEEERMRIQDLTVLIYEYREHEKHSLEKKDMKSFSKIIRMVHETSKVTDSISNLQNIRQKFHVHLEIIMRDMGILENVSVYLRKQGDGLKALKTKNMNVRDYMGRVKSQIKDFEKITTRAKAEMDKMFNIRDDIQKQKQELAITQEKAKRERQEMEVLTSELEMKKRENQQIIRKCIQTEQEGKKVWAAVKEEKDLLKRETQKRKKELNLQLERIIRERDKLEIMNLRLKSKTDEGRSKMVKSRTSVITDFQNQVQKHWELIEMCIEKYKHMKTHCTLMIAAVKDEKQHIKVQAKLTTLTREEVANTRIEMKKRMEVMIHEFKNVQQKQEYLGQVETNIQKEKNSIKSEKKRTTEKTEMILLRKEERENETEIQKGEMMILKDKKQNIKILRTPIRRKRTSITQAEKSMLKSKRKLNQETEQTKHEYLKEKEELTGVKQLENKEKGKSGMGINYTEKDDNELEADDHKEAEKKKSTQQGENVKENEVIQTSENNTEKGKLEEMSNGVMNRKEIKNQWKPKLGKRKDAETRKSRLEQRKVELKKSQYQLKEKFETEQHLEKQAAQEKEEGEGLNKVSEMMNKEKVDLELMRSEILKQSDILEQEKQDMEDEKDMLEITMAELQEKKEHADNLFDEINREKTKMNDLNLQLQTNQRSLEEMMKMMTAKQKQHELKNEEFKKQTQELESIKKNVLAERQELEIQKKSFKKKVEEIEAFMKTMKEEKEQVNQIKAEMERERDAMLNESDRLEGERSELKMTEDQVKKRMESIETLREKLEWLNGRMNEHTKHNIDRLQLNSDAALQLHTVLEQKLAALDDQKNIMACYTEMVEKQQDGMMSLLSKMTTQREEMENEWKQQLEDEKQHLMKLKAELKEEREHLNKASEMMNKEKVDLELMRSEILKQSDILEQEKQDMEDEKDMLEITMAELQEKKEHADNLFDEINREKTKMNDLNLQLQTNQRSLEEMMKMMALKQKQHEFKNADVNKQPQELESTKKKVLFEGDKSEVQKKSFTLDTLEITMAELTTTQEKNYPPETTPKNKITCQMMKCIDPVKEMFLNEREEMKETRSEIIITQDQFCIVLNTIVHLRSILELLNQKTYKVSCMNIDRFEHKSRTILKLLTTLGHKCAEIDQLINLITSYYCQIQCEKTYMLKGKLHKAVQTVAAVQECLHEHDGERLDLREFKESECKKDVQQSPCVTQTDKWEHQQKSGRGQGDLRGTAVSLKPEREGVLIRAEGKEVINVEIQKLAKVSELSAEIDDFTEQQMLNRECLRKIWKGTRVEQKEISHMKCSAHDMRNNLEKRLKVINQFVKKTLSQKGKTPKKTKLEKDQSEDTLSQNDWNGDHKSLNEKYLELQQLKMCMFSQFEKLHIREKVTLTTSNKTNQKHQIDIFAGHPTVQVLQQASTKINQEQINEGETEQAPETSSGFLCQLRHYCYRCCCCAHCKQVFPKEK